MSEIGVVGWGIMGGAMAENLLADGVEIIGYDPDPSAALRLAAAGATAAANVSEVARRVRLLIVSVASLTAYQQVTDELAATAPGELTVIDTCTMPLPLREAAALRLAANGIALLDCPISGTGAQAESRDLVFLASGDREAFERARSLLERLGRAVHYLGEFGAGSKMKYVANLLVGIHNVAAAEAMVLAEKAGIDPRQVHEVLYDSAATSRMFQLRFPLMIENRYTPPTAKVSMFVKDLDIITSYAASLGVPTPLLDVVAPLYNQALVTGMADEDAAAVCRLLEAEAGIDR
ncbi:MAG TPA: NAD(P)-dependent oxidoreductase [Acidimicrobiia bacterium]|nr:NAD(P)-dependent oxidoreductase [Acidimicrobiia bacterium]